MFQTELFFLALTFSQTWVNIISDQEPTCFTVLCARWRSRTKLFKHFYDLEMLTVIGAQNFIETH